ncbi:MAG: calcium-binding protein, partial [Nocardioidaceae bacterium]
DVVHGGAGDDMVLRGDDFDETGGADEVHGDAGDDTIRGEPGAGADVVDGGDGTDMISFFLGGRSVRIDVAAGTATGDAVDTLHSIEDHRGSEYDDVLTGSSGADNLEGNGGNDIVAGRGGPDILSANSGTITGGSGDDTFVASDDGTNGLTVALGTGADRAVFGGTMRHSDVRGGPGADVFQFPNPKPALDSDGTDVELRGGLGADRLTFAHNSHPVRIDVEARTGTWSQGRITFAHVEEFHGSDRSDVLLGSTAADRLFGHRGDDLLKGRPGPDLLRSGKGRDKVHGGRGSDKTYGGHDRDRLKGGRGPDLLRGGTGWDKAYGGHGRDRCSAEVRHSCRP